MKVMENQYAAQPEACNNIFTPIRLLTGRVDITTRSIIAFFIIWEPEEFLWEEVTEKHCKPETTLLATVFSMQITALQNLTVLQCI